VTSHRRDDVRPRYGRIVLLVSALLVTLVSVLGGVGVIPSGETPAVAADDREPEPAPAVEETEPTNPAQGARSVERNAAARMLPRDSGEGRRVVFSQGGQRVWLVGENGQVKRTYLVSGSLYDNLDQGTHTVYSRSEDATGILDSGSMKWFVRFAYGDTGAAIGFHDIPVLDGEKVQSPGELGTPTSHGCIRQRTKDAKAMWDFAEEGTTVVVVA
jgi:lipoprotein-anchoring transpeptidase ErfK/SrfK